MLALTLFVTPQVTHAGFVVDAVVSVATAVVDAVVTVVNVGANLVVAGVEFGAGVVGGALGAVASGLGDLTGADWLKGLGSDMSKFGDQAISDTGCKLGQLDKAPINTKENGNSGGFLVGSGNNAVGGCGGSGNVNNSGGNNNVVGGPFNPNNPRRGNPGWWPFGNSDNSNNPGGSGNGNGRGGIGNAISVATGCIADQLGVTSSVLINKQMTWTITIPSNLSGLSIDSVDWQGTDLNSVTDTASLKKIYTTVGQKSITATLLGTLVGRSYALTCTATTTAKSDAGVIKEI